MYRLYIPVIGTDGNEHSFQLLRSEEADREVRFVIFLKRTRRAFRSSVAINISAVMILFFNIFITVW
jgi:hypothetical protein